MEMTVSPAVSIRRAHSLVLMRRACASSAAVIALLVLAGWTFEIEMLKRILPGFVAMNPTTAICLLMAAVSLFIHANKAASRAAATVVFALATAKLVEVAIGFPLRVDQLFFVSSLAEGGGAPNRMAPNTAFALASLGLALITATKSGTRAPLYSQFLAGLAAFISFFAVIGYLLGLGHLYGIARFIPMALHTAFCILVLSAGVFTAHPGRGLMKIFLDNGPAGSLSRTILPLAIFVPIAVGSLRLWGERAGLYGTQMGVALMVLANVTLTTSLLLIIILPLYRTDRLRRQREVSVARSEEQYRLAERVASVGHWRMEFPSKSIKWSDEIFRIAGLDSDKGIPSASNVLELYHPDDRDQVKSSLLHALKTGEGSESTIRLVRPDGEIRSVKSHSVAERDTDGRVCAVFGVFADVTELEKSRQAAEEATVRIEAIAARQSAIFDGAIDGIFTLNPSGSIETVNAAAVRMFGYETVDLVRRDVSMLIDIAPDGDGEFLKRLGTSQGELEGGLVRQMDARRKDGETFPVDVAFGAMPLPTGVHVVAIVRDISERRRMEQLKDEFVSTVSHELRTPLTSIAGSLGLLAGGAAGALPEKATRLIQIAQANSQRLVRLINDILDIEKIESGKLRLDLATLDLRDIARRSVDGVQGYAAEFGAALTLPEGDPVMVRGDADRLIQVVTNLLSNALKFSPRGGEVLVTVDTETRVARLSVFDQGPGIPEAFRARIFSKFAQADGSDTRAKGGTGLGLAIAREIAERHGGRLWFESAEGHGASFHLDLPLLEEMRNSEAAPGLRLLIVEDDADAAEILREMLEMDGFAADVASTAREALSAARTGVYSALLIDLQLPDADGIGLIRALRGRAETREVPVVVVSADTARGKARGRSLEVVDWLEKPFDQDRLRAAVSAIYQRSSDHKPRILHVDDDRDILEVTASALGASADITPAVSLAAARAVLARMKPDLVILDLGLPDGSGLELLGDLGDDKGRTVPVIVYSAQEMDGALADKVEAVLIKSRTSLAGLARTVRRLTEGRGESGC